MLRPVVLTCWLFVVVAIITVVVANGIVFTEARNINQEVDNARTFAETT